MILNKKKIFKHFLFWIGICLFYIFSATNHEVFKQSVETALCKLPTLIVAAYVFNYWQVPFFLKKKKYVFFGVSMFFVIILLTILYRAIEYLFLDKYCTLDPIPFLRLDYFPLYMLTFHFPALLMYFYKTNKEQELEKEKLNKLEKEKISTELKYLKAQLNPHFLFNTLNNLYSYVLMKSPKAPDMVLQLSGILDYILYKSQLPLVAITEEINTIENYIALERIKYGDRLKVVFTKEILNKELQITPLLLLSIVENAFKHGVSGNITKPKVTIAFIENEKGVSFSVWNTTSSHIEINKTDDYKSGIGLSNIKRQLDLIYPEKHTIETVVLKDSFQITITLNI